MKAILWIISLLWWINVCIQAQCDKTLVVKATEQAGKDAVLVRDFKVKLKEGDKRNPSPASRFSVLMQQGIVYRFNVVGAAENPEVVMLQLYDKSSLLGSTFDFDKVLNIGNFQYQCQRTGDYQVVLSFRNSKAGCAAGIMSMVVDSAFLSARQEAEISEDEVLYLGIDNQLTISTDSLGEDKLEVTIDNGIITNRGTHYTVKVAHGDHARIKVIRKGTDGKTQEETVKEFKILPLPDPKIHLESSRDGYINAYELSMVNRLEIKPGVYKILGFFISTGKVSHSGLQSNGEFFSSEQYDFMKTLKVNDTFYVNDIKIEKPDGTIMLIGSQEYLVR